MKPRFEISKTIGTSFSKYKGNAIKLSLQTPSTVDEVVLKVKNRPELTRKITTFRDSNGEVFERAFDYKDKPYRNTIYSTETHVINNDEFVTSRTKKDYVLSRGMLDYFKKLSKMPAAKKTILWYKIKTETNHFSENIETGEKVLSQVRITNGSRRNQKKHTFIEFPHIKNNKVQKNKPKFLSFLIKKDTNTVIDKSINSSGVEVPTDDTFLGFRALTKDGSKKPFAKYFLRARKMDDKNITINDAYNPLNERDPNFTAIFNAEDGVVNFNKDAKIYSKAQIAGISAHETEHSWHYFLQGLLKGGDTPWQTDMSQKFGKLTSPELIEEAKVYDNAIENYVPFWKDIKAYRENPIEILANKKDKDIREMYNSQRKTLEKDFPHIPPETL